MLSCGSNGFPCWLVRSRQKINKQISSLSQLARFVTATSPYPIPKGTDAETRHCDVGIVEFLGSHSKLRASAQKSVEDFHVHEIDVNGRIVKLTDLGPPKTDEGRFKYIHCTLYKEGVGGAEALSYIAKWLRLHPSIFKCSGRKDKHAKTSQRMSLPCMDIHHLIRFSSQCQRIKLGNFAYSLEQLTLGQLRGNYFTLALKNLQLDNPGSGCDGGESRSNYDAVLAAMEVTMKSLRDVGFINYFGLQRFGKFYGVGTHVIGKSVLQMKWEEVFDLILTPSPTDRNDIVQAKQLWFSERDPVKMEKILSESRMKRGSSEFWHLLNGLTRHYQGGKGNLRAAFHKIPKFVRDLYMPAFASFLFNNVATFRLQEFGLVPIPGDCVYTVPPFNDPSLCSSDAHSFKNEYASTKLEWSWPQVKPLTEKDIASGQYSIYDVLLPVPGIQVSSYLNPKLQDFYENFLHNQGLDGDCFSRYRPNYGAPQGLYRPLLIRPQNVGFKLISYNDSDNLEKLIPSDLDILNEDSECPNSSSSLFQSTNNNHGGGTTTTEVKDKICAIVEFSLPRSSYATMALREILQISSPVSTYEDEEI